VEKTLHRNLQEVDEVHQLFQVNVIYVKPVLLAVVKTFGMTTLFGEQTTEFCVNLLQPHQNGNYLQIITMCH
jgi:hypothetical protein